MIKRLPVLILLLILPLFLTACSITDIFGGGKPSNQPVTLNIWGLWENPEVMSSLIQKYKETHPNVTINYDDRSILKPDDYKDRVFMRIAQEGTADIIVVHNTWVPQLKSSLTAAPAGVLTSADYSAKFYPTANESAVLDGNVYAVPVYYDGLALVYNKKHFEEIDQLEPPTAWEEFRRLALELTVKGSDNKLVRAGAAMGTADNIAFFSDIIGLLFAQANVAVPTGLDALPAQHALLFYTNFATEDHVWDSTFVEASSAFIQDKVSMIFVPSWNLLDIINSRPDMKIGVAAVPQVSSDRPVAWGSYWMMVVPKTSTNSAAAWEFLKFMTQEDTQMSMFNRASQYRQFGAPYSLTSLATQASSNAYIGPILQTAPYAKSSLFAGRAGNKTYVEALRAAVNMLINAKSSTEVSPATVLKSAKDTIMQAKY